MLPPQGETVIRSFVLPCSALPQAAYIEALRVTFGDPTSVRHAEIRMDSTNSSQDRDARDQMVGFAGRPHYDSVRQPMELFAVWTPWTPIQAAPPGTGWRIHPQADLVVTCHLQPTGKECRIRPKAGVWLQAKAPERRILTLRLANESLKVRPGMADASVRDRFDLPVKARMHAVYPAANRYTRAISLDTLGPRVRDAEGALTPVDAKRVLDIPEWQPYSQEIYRFREPIELEEGTRLELQIRLGYESSGLENLHPVAWGGRENEEWSEIYVQLSVESDQEAVRLASAVSHHQLALTIEGQESRDENDVEAHLTLALVYSELGQYDTAAAHGEKALSLAPNSERAHAALGAVHVSQQFFYTAQEHLEKAVKLDPNDAFAWYNLGNVFYQYQSIDKARDAFLKAEKLNPRDYRVANNLGTIFLGDSKPDQARIRFERIVQALPYNAPAMANLGRAYQQLARNEEAAQCYENAMLLSPALKESAPVVGNLAKTYQELGRNADAIRCFEKAVALAPALKFELEPFIAKAKAKM